jgi:hypothetical protein
VRPETRGLPGRGSLPTASKAAMAPPQADYGPDGPSMCLARHGVILCSGDLRGDLLAVKRAAMTSLGAPRIVRKPLAAAAASRLARS